MYGSRVGGLLRPLPALQTQIQKHDCDRIVISTLLTVKIGFKSNTYVSKVEEQLILSKRYLNKSPYLVQ